jgi:hypothetical protein
MKARWNEMRCIRSNPYTVSAISVIMILDLTIDGACAFLIALCLLAWGDSSAYLRCRMILDAPRTIVSVQISLPVLEHMLVLSLQSKQNCNVSSLVFTTRNEVPPEPRCDSEYVCTYKVQHWSTNAFP